MNRFQVFLDKTRISANMRKTPQERAAFFIWYHLRATGESDVDLGIIEAYLKESGTQFPGLHQLYPLLVSCAAEGSIPGRFRLPTNDYMDINFKADVFEARGLTPLYFTRGPDGMIIKIGSRRDLVKYWPQKHWAAFWIAMALAVLGAFL